MQKIVIIKNGSDDIFIARQKGKQSVKNGL